MSFKHIFSYEKKLKIVEEYLEGINGFRESCRIYGMCQSSLKNWIRLYKTFGPLGLQTNNKCSKYSSELKQNAIDDYLSGKFTFNEVLIKYKIRSGSQLKRWIMKYNSHKELKSSDTGGTTIMTKGRKTTYEERIEIVKYCIEHENNYSETAEKYKVSYQQVYNWLKKYKKNGIEGLIDRRGKSKSKNEMSELEKLRAENRLLKAENKKKEMEIIFLKKLDEIERRRF